MARSTSPAARIADVSWGQMTQFATRLHTAGLTGNDIQKLLDNPELLTKMVEATKALLAEPTWDSETGLHYHPTQSWNTIAPGVQMKLPESHCAGCCRACRAASTDHILIHVKIESCICGMHFEEPTRVHLSDSWTDVAPGVQLRKTHSNGLAVRKLKTL